MTTKQSPFLSDEEFWGGIEVVGDSFTLLGDLAANFPALGSARCGIPWAVLMCCPVGFLFRFPDWP